MITIFRRSALQYGGRRECLAFSDMLRILKGSCHWWLYKRDDDTTGNIQGLDMMILS